MKVWEVRKPKSGPKLNARHLARYRLVPVSTANRQMEVPQTTELKRRLVAHTAKLRCELYETSKNRLWPLEPKNAVRKHRSGF